MLQWDMVYTPCVLATRIELGVVPPTHLPLSPPVPLLLIQRYYTSFICVQNYRLRTFTAFLHGFSRSVCPLLAMLYNALSQRKICAR